MDANYDKPEPHRDEVDEWPGATILEFGAGWCPHCQAAQPAIAAALEEYPDIRHVKVGDGKGLPLGRSFRVKLWPTLIFFDGGKEKSRLVRPATTGVIAEKLAEIDPALD